MKKTNFKQHLFLLLILLVSPLIIYNFYNPETIKQVNPPLPYTNNNIYDKFLLGAMDEENGARSSGYTTTDQLELNVSHAYADGRWHPQFNRYLPHGRIEADSVFANVNDYKDSVTTYLSDIYNNHNGRRTIAYRPKITWLCYGQSSIYQAEDIPVGNNTWFYSYNRDNASVGVPEEGGTVIHCRTIPSNQVADNPGFVCKRLKANTEQCCPDENFNGDINCDWYVKPRLKIPVNFVISANFEIPVCKVYVLNQDGVTPKDSFTIKVKYFLDQNGVYDGSYKEEFNFFGEGDQTFHGSLGYKWWYRARGHSSQDALDTFVNKSDIQVKWLGYCDMWIDYVKVENDVANDLLKGIRDPWIQDEVDYIAFGNQSSSVPLILKYYIELTESNNYPCMAYVNQKLKQYSELHGYTVDLMSDFTPAINYAHLRWNENFPIVGSSSWLYKNYIQKIGFTQFFAESYPLTSVYGITHTTWSEIPNTLPTTTGGLVLANAVSPPVYDTWLQNEFNFYPYSMETTSQPFNDCPKNSCGYSPCEDKGNFRYIMKLGSEISRNHNIPFIFMPQAHLWYWPGEIRREPTNEELNMMANVAVSYSAKGLQWFWFRSLNGAAGCSYDPFANGMVDTNENLVENNQYMQEYDKWKVFRDISQRMKSWENVLLNSDNSRNYSYIVNSEWSNMVTGTYFKDIVTYIEGNDIPSCYDQIPDTTDGAHPPIGLRFECIDERYLQTAVFRLTPDDGNRYFMLVNRRCSPKLTSSTNDGERFIRVMFDQNSNEFPLYNSWKIVEVNNPTVEVGRFNKTLGNPSVDLGWFDPGEGKLYKIIPIPKSGGILAGDENITGASFTCEAPVYNNGHNITIGANTTIHFNDSSRFVMNGGMFTVGDQNTSAPQNITSDAVPGGFWRGHSFTNCEVKIYGATFTGLTNDTNTYAVNITDCPVVDIRNCTFNTNSSLKGGVNAICFSNPFLAINNIYIGSNTFNSSGSTIPTINVSSYAGVTTPLIIENNTFNEGNTAVFLTSVIGGAVKGNTITDNYIGINALTSSIDVVQNNISSTVNGSIGLFAAGGSELKLNSSGIFTLGGLNSISNEGTGTNNINVDGSYFLLDDGENIFNISSDQSSYHLYGYFPMFTAVTTEETNNCFKVDDSPVDPPINMVTSGYQGSQITFNFNPYLSGCEIIGGGDGLAINLGDGIYDTIYTGGSGSGGSESSNNQIPLSRGVTAEGSRGVFLLTSAKNKYDSISVLMRYRNYTQAKTKCLDLINTYPDSIQSIFAVSKLFLATVASDTTYNAVNNLKIFYENLILNHQSNTSLVKRANYYILKCKVRMREYSQALLGFQQIINQNPYSYEGLIARWDYMATSLLVQGQGGGEPSITNYELVITGDSEDDIDGNDDDKKPFTKEQRQDIRKSINTVIEISKNDDETKIKKLEEKSELGDVNASKELSQMKSLKQVVKTEKPKSIIEHVRIVSEDIRKVFGSNTSSKGNEPKNIPLVYKISQNYPNPFNPVTKINYDLPRDSKVNIVIYDILGREVKRLVNNELKTAGSYIVDFNAMNYASGVYFYRIEAEEPNGNKFVDSKKMVLLK